MKRLLFDSIYFQKLQFIQFYFTASFVSLPSHGWQCYEKSPNNSRGTVLKLERGFNKLTVFFSR